MARTPWYIDALARHDPPTMRLLAYMALAGREGVLGERDLAVSALTTPGPSIRVAPGAFGILNTGVGGAYEAYVDKFDTEIVKSVSATDATVGGRSDLVIARIKNPYAVGTGTWPSPASPADGPYWDIDVIEGVAANTNSVHVHNAAWTAITLARIVRPINTSAIQQSHIVDLRSLVDLSGERIIIIDSPPAEAPPVAQAYFTGSVHCNNNQELLKTNTSFIDFPSQASWSVAIPRWAVSMTIDVRVAGLQLLDGDQTGEMRLMLSSTGSAPSIFDLNAVPGVSPIAFNPTREILSLGGTMAITAAMRGKQLTAKLQTRTESSTPTGKLKALKGTYANIFLNFQRSPCYD